MSNEMKLITALCEALGFEVEQSLDYKETREKHKLSTMSIHCNIRENVIKSDGSYDVDGHGNYLVRLIDPEITYKLIPTAPTGEER